MKGSAVRASVTVTMKPAMRWAALWLTLLALWAPVEGAWSQGSGPAPLPGAGADRLAEAAYRHLGRLEFQEASAKALEATDLDPNHARAHAVRGVALLWVNDVESGKREIHRAFELNKDLALVHVGMATLAWNSAASLESQQPGNPRGAREAKKLLDEVEAEFKQAISLDAKEVLAHHGLGVSYYAQKRFAEAEKEFRKVLQLDPEFVAAYFNLGNVYLAREQWKEAESAYRQAIQRNEQNPAFYAALAAALLGQQKKTEARAAADDAKRLGLDPSHWIFAELNRAKAP